MNGNNTLVTGPILQQSLTPEQRGFIDRLFSPEFRGWFQVCRKAVEKGHLPRRPEALDGMLEGLGVEWRELAQLHLEAAEALLRPCENLGDTAVRLASRFKQPTGLIADLLAELAAPSRDQTKETGGENSPREGGSLRPAERIVSVGVALVEKIGANETGDGLVARLVLELVSNGAGDIYPVPAQLFVTQDDLFRDTLKSAWAAVLARDPELSPYDLRYQLERLDNRPLPLQWVGNSHGGAVRVALESLRDRESIGRLGLSQTVICAAVDQDGTLRPVGDWFQKRSALLRLSAPLPHTLVMARDQDLSPMPLKEDPLSSSPYRHHRDELSVIRAGTVEEALNLLKVQNETRWCVDCCLPERVEGFVGREKLKRMILQAIEAEVAPSRLSSGYSLVVGGLGTGKSSFMAELIHEAFRQGRHPVYHIIGHATSYSATQRGLATCLYSRFRRKYCLRAHPERPELCLEHRLELLLQQINVELEARGEIEIFFIDGLDQIESPPGFRVLPGVLPRKLPSRIFGILSSRPNMEWLSPAQKVRLFNIGGCGEEDGYACEEEREDVRRFMEQQADALGCRLGPRLTAQVISQRQPPVFFTVAARFAQLADPKFPSQDRDQLLNDPAPWVVPAEELIADERQTLLEKAAAHGLKAQELWEWLGMLAVARTPLTLRQLRELGLWNDAVTALVLRLAGNFFVPRVPGAREDEQPYRFGHPGYHRAILSELLAVQLKACHLRLARACANWRSLHGAARSYALRFWVAHLLAAEDAGTFSSTELAGALLDPEYLQARLVLPENGGLEVFELVGELQRALDSVQDPNLRGPLEALLTVIDGDSHALSSNPEILLQQLFNSLSEEWNEHTPLGQAIRQARARSSQPMLLKRASFGYRRHALLRTLTRHRRPVTCLAISPDSKWIVTGGADNKVIVWSLSTGLPLPPLRGHCKSVEAVAYTADGKWLVSASLDGSLRVWDMDYERLRGGDANATAPQCEMATPIGAPALSLATDPLSNLVAAGCRDGAVRLWDIRTGHLLRVLEGGEKQVLSVAFSPDGRRLAAGCRDDKVRIWDLAAGTKLELDHGVGAEAVVFSPDGKQLASSGGLNEGFVKFWDPATGALKRTVRGRGHYGLVALAFCPDGKHLVTGGWDRTVGVWEVSRWEPLPAWLGHGNVVWAVAVSANGRFLASAGSDRSVKIWDLRAIFQPSQPAPLELDLPHDMVLHSGTFVRTGQLVATCSDDQTVIIRSALTGRAQLRLQTHDSTVSIVRFSPDGQRLATGSYPVIRLFDCQGRELRTPLQGHSDHVLALAFSDDGRLLASGSQDTSIMLWSIPDGNHLATLHGHEQSVRAVTFCAGGTRLASASDDTTVRVWEVRTGRLLHNLAGHRHRVKSVAYCPTRALLASGAGETVRLWDLHTGKCLKILCGHRHEIWSLAFSDDGRWLASGSADGTARLWDVSSGAHLGCFPCLDSVLALWFSADGRELRVADAGGAVHVPDLFHLELSHLPS